MKKGIFVWGFLFVSAIYAAPLEIRASQETNREKLLHLFSGEWVSRALYVATKLELADQLQSGSKSIEELAKTTNSNPDSLYRLLHLLEGFGIFEEESSRVFTNTALSSLLIKTHPDTLHALSLFYGEEIHQSWDELLNSVRTGTPSFQITHKQPVFQYFKENPLRRVLFQEAMKEKSMAVIHSALSSYDFSRFKSVYDIGGGYGQFMEGLLAKYSEIQGVILELPEVVDTIKQQTKGCENPRMNLISGDFFISVPQGGDAYLLKSVLHDWDDEKCREILNNCHQAMDENSRLLIIEVVLLPKDFSIYANCMDLLMMAVTGGKERNLNSFKKILENSGFVLENVYPTTTEFSILEARKVSRI